MFFDLPGATGALARLAKALHQGFGQDTNFDLNGDGTVDMVNVFTWSAITDATSYEVEISRCATVGGTYVVTGLGGITKSLEWRHICNVNWYYKARVRARNAYGQPGTWTSLSSAVQPVGKPTGPVAPTNIAVGIGSNGTVNVLVTIPTPEKDYAHTRLYVGTTNDQLSAGNPIRFEPAVSNGSAFLAIFYLTGLQPNTTYYLWADNVDRSGNVSTVYSTRFAGKSFVAPYIDNLDIADNTIRERFQAQTNTTQAVTASTTTTIETVVCAHGAGCNTVDFWLYFRNVSGGARTFDITLEDASTTLNTWAAVTIADGGFFSASWTGVGPSGTSTNFRMRVNPTANATVNSTRLTSTVGRR